MTSILPPQFAQLEKYSAWALPTEAERRLKKCKSSMAELQELYDALATNIDAIIEYLNRIPFEQIDGPDKKLLDLACCFTTLEISVSAWGKPDLPDIFPVERWEVVEERW